MPQRPFPIAPAGAFPSNTRLPAGGLAFPESLTHSLRTLEKFRGGGLEKTPAASGCSSIFLLVERDGFLEVDSRRYPVTAPALLFLAEGQTLLFDPQTGPPVGYLYSFTPQEQTMLGSLWSEYSFDSTGLPLSIPLTTEKANPFLVLFQRIETENRSNRPRKEELIHLYAQALLIEASRLQPAPPAGHDTTTPQANVRLVKRFLHLVDQYFSGEVPSFSFNPRSVSEYAAALSVHPNHLSDVIKHATGKTPGEHIRDRIIGQAKDLLQYSDLSVSEIAYRLHFKDPSYFSRFFKRYTADAASDYRDGNSKGSLSRE